MSDLTTPAVPAEKPNLESELIKVFSSFGLSSNIVHKYAGIALACVGFFTSVFHGNSQIAAEAIGAIYAISHI